MEMLYSLPRFISELYASSQPPLSYRTDPAQLCTSFQLVPSSNPKVISQA